MCLLKSFATSHGLGVIHTNSKLDFKEPPSKTHLALQFSEDDADVFEGLKVCCEHLKLVRHYASKGQ